jgi:hypothetical protein
MMFDQHGIEAEAIQPLADRGEEGLRLHASGSIARIDPDASERTALGSGLSAVSALRRRRLPAIDRVTLDQ